MTSAGSVTRASLVLLLLGRCWGGEITPEAPRGFELHDDACGARLSIIHEALQAYRRAHDDLLPTGLSELYPDFLSDPSFLSCPEATATGRFTPGLGPIWTNARHEAFASYNWEWSKEPVVPSWLDGKPAIDWHAVKSALLKSPIGPWVPMVRCELHRNRTLNLSVTGKIYASPLYWEEMFVDQFPQPYAEPYLILRDQRPIPDRLPPRNRGLPSTVVDLAPSSNACLGDPWLHGRGAERLPLPADRATVVWSDGIVFEIRGIVQTGGATQPRPDAAGFPGRLYPLSSAPIEINARCARLHLLHATAFTALPGEEVGGYEIRTKNGAVIRAPLRMGIEIDSWRAERSERPLRPAWTGEIDGVGPCAIFHWTWQNPNPEDEIGSLRLEAVPTSVASPFVVAISVDSALPVSR